MEEKVEPNFQILRDFQGWQCEETRVVQGAYLSWQSIGPPQCYDFNEFLFRMHILNEQKSFSLGHEGITSISHKLNLHPANSCFHMELSLIPGEISRSSKATDYQIWFYVSFQAVY